MMEITFLGTSGSAPGKERGMPCVSLTRNGELFLFDCGEGTQMQMLKYGINGYKLKCIFLSHAHGDHIIGVAGLLRTLALNGRKEPLRIFIPRGYEHTVRSLVVFDKAVLGYDVEVSGVGQGSVYKGKDFEVFSFRLNHTIPTVGYLFRENDKLSFIKGKCEKLGIKGEMFSRLEEGKRIRVDGRSIGIRQVTLHKSGIKVAYVADTRPSANAAKAVLSADILIHESSYSSEQSGLASARKHSTSQEAATIAKRAKVKSLILTHFSTRYKSAEALEREARKVFPKSSAAYDGYTVKV